MGLLPEVKGWKTGLLRNGEGQRGLTTHFVTLPRACPERKRKEHSRERPVWWSPGSQAVA